MAIQTKQPKCQQIKAAEHKSMNNLMITTIELGQCCTNCYLVNNEQTRETLIIDPADDAGLICDKCNIMQLTPTAIMLTHGHFDHTMAAEYVKKAYQIPIFAGTNEKQVLGNPLLNISLIAGQSIRITADKWVNDGEILDLAGSQIEVISTPGHTVGSVCYYIRKENLLLSGDTLFNNSLGRTDLPTGNYTQIVESVKNKLFILPDDTRVYCGHGGMTTIYQEKVNWNQVT